ncbi:MAG TPA: hypothetical protein VLG47_07930 [Candidatus Saccharimonadales bacterium]|nr:hypothetical protein [Candidatus Saccharimonadales bacterium]
MSPASDNVIFYDTEFSSLDPYIGEILSIGLVKVNGESLYLELDYTGEYSDWVKENILDDLKGPKVSRTVAKMQVENFIGGNRPYMVANVNCYDAVYTYKIFGADHHPFNWIPVDFASMLFAHGIDPEVYINREEKFFARLGVDFHKYYQHNALDDAKLLRDTYLALVRSRK